jgi:hypothetical protein
MRKYIIIMSNTNGTYYLKFANGQYKGTRKQHEALTMTLDFAQSIINKLHFNGSIDLAIV